MQTSYLEAPLLVFSDVDPSVQMSEGESNLKRMWLFRLPSLKVETLEDFLLLKQDWA